ncbi:MAG: LacI family DNA-binding transcriptional regulator [Chloroflexi bacterium]|nr:LacI family DNA-binding transcriptional regulator [Chloroflexota bacterium]
MPSHGQGSPRPTIRDIAHVSGVSVCTVSRVLNDRPDVAQGTRERVQSAITDVRIVPAAAARALPKGGRPAIGLLTYDGFASAPFYQRVIEGAMMEATRQGSALIVTPVGRDTHSPDLGVDFLISHRAAGVVRSSTSHCRARVQSASSAPCSALRGHGRCGGGDDDSAHREHRPAVRGVQIVQLDQHALPAHRTADLHRQLRGLPDASVLPDRPGRA